jgi:hypothetical protein
LPENTELLGVKRYYRYEVKINQEKFVSYAKNFSATPAILVALLVSKAIRNVCPNVEESDKPIVSNLVGDLRQGAGFENTYKKCMAGIDLPYSVELSLSEQVAYYRNMVKEHKIRCAETECA